MALTKKDKVELSKGYVTWLQSAKNVVVLKMFWVPVNAINALRMDLEDMGAMLKVVKKRVFLRAVADAWFQWGTLEELQGSVIALHIAWDEFGPLKHIAKVLKVWKKEENAYGFDYLWGWYDKQWKDANYVKALAELPSAQELMWKFAYLMNYPLQSFAMALNEVAKKKWE